MIILMIQTGKENQKKTENYSGKIIILIR